METIDNSKIKGDGPIVNASEGWLPITNIPLLNKIHLSNGIIFLNKNNEKTGGIRMDPNQDVEGILQKGNEAYLVSAIRKGAYDGWANWDYALQKTEDSNSVISSKPVIIQTESTPCMRGDKIINDIYDGKNNSPTMAFNSGGHAIGYKNSLFNPFQAINVINLDNQEQYQIIEQADEIIMINKDGKNLISCIIPTSNVPRLIDGKKSNILKNEFSKDDLGLTNILNELNDKIHAPNCWGDSSCINRGEFELVQSEGYPRYRLDLDSKGDIHDATRIFDQKKYQEAIKSRTQSI